MKEPDSMRYEYDYCQGFKNESIFFNNELCSISLRAYSNALTEYATEST